MTGYWIEKLPQKKELGSAKINAFLNVVTGVENLSKALALDLKSKGHNDNSVSYRNFSEPLINEFELINSTVIKIKQNISVFNLSFENTVRISTVKVEHPNAIAGYECAFHDTRSRLYDEVVKEFDLYKDIIESHKNKVVPKSWKGIYITREEKLQLVFNFIEGVGAVFHKIDEDFHFISPALDTAKMMREIHHRRKNNRTATVLELSLDLDYMADLFQRICIIAFKMPLTFITKHEAKLLSNDDAISALDSFQPKLKNYREKRIGLTNP